MAIEGLPDDDADIDFENVPVGEVRSRSYDVYNSGIEAETVIVHAPNPFSANNTVITIEPSSFATVTLNTHL